MHRSLSTKRDVRHHLLDFAIDERSPGEGVVLLNHLVNDHWVGGPKENFPDGEVKALMVEHAQLHALDILAPDVPFAHEREFDTLVDAEQVAHLNEHGYQNTEEVNRWSRDFRFRMHDQVHGYVEGVRRITQDPKYLVGPTSFPPIPKELQDFANLARACGFTVTGSADFDESGNYVMRVTASIKQEESE